MIAKPDLPVYLDYNATTPLDPEVAAAMRPFLDDYFGNPSSAHPFGSKARQAVEKARASVAKMINCQPHEIIFTSGGSESTNWALKGYALANKNRGNHIITSAIEHPATTEVCKWLETQGFKITYLPVDKFGLIDVDEFENAITPATILATIMHSNNEVGTLEPIADIAAVAKKHNVAVHTDAAQSLGKVKLDVEALGVQMMTLACHKFYAPKGIGVLYLKSGIVLEKMMHGAPHESGRRAGTENTIHIAGLGAAADLVVKNLELYAAKMKSTRDRLWNKISNELPSAKLNGHPELRLPNTLSVSFPHVQANTLLSEIQDQVAASAGAACHSDKIEVSHVLSAMKVPVSIAMGTVRLSTGRYTTEEQVDYAADVIIKAVQRLQPEATTGDLEIEEEFAEGQPVKLTSFTRGLGCACKLRPQALHEVLKRLGSAQHENLIVGTNTGDDAAVYKVSESNALVATLDFLTPIVDDPYSFGQIACANAISDVYAMGGKPVYGLNIVSFPSNRLPLSVLEQILRGANDIAKEAGVIIIGGHTIEGSEPSFGLSVTGFIHPNKVWKNSSVKADDVLILTKAIGTGLITTAMKRGIASEEAARAALKSMSTLNNKPLSVAESLPDAIHAATDVTGFGLLGHLRGMTVGSGFDCEVYSSKVPLLPEALYLAATADLVPGGTRNNLAYVKHDVVFDSAVSEPLRLVLADAQTSGGLLLSVDPQHAEQVVAMLKSGPDALPHTAVVGRFRATSGGKIYVQH